MRKYTLLLVALVLLMILPLVWILGIVGHSSQLHRLLNGGDDLALVELRVADRRLHCEVRDKDSLAYLTERFRAAKRVRMVVFDSSPRLAAEISTSEGNFQKCGIYARKDGFFVECYSYDDNDELYYWIEAAQGRPPKVDEFFSQILSIKK